MNEPLGGVLYLVGTPIGNLSDLSPRAEGILKNTDFLAAEDTRVTAKLLARFAIKKPMISYHEHNQKSQGEQIVSRLKAGESGALVTDAGMPAISDPGEDLVRLCAQEGIPVVCIPGPCAAVTALSLSALSTRRFCFEGFLGAEKKQRRQRLSSLQEEDRTMIFYEAPHRLVRTLEDLAEAFGADRRIALCRELTKLNEQVLRTDLAGALQYFQEKEPRGEFVLVVDGAQKSQEEAFWKDWSLQEHLDFYLAQGQKRMDACKAVAKDRGVSKSEIYAALLA